MTFVEWILFVSAGLIVYVFLGYPILLALFSSGLRPPQTNMTQISPRVTLIISAFNEEEVIQAKLENSLACDYPMELLEIMVVSDASDDRTDEIVCSISADNVVLLRMEERGGKTLGLNAAVAKAQGEIIVFSDANAMYYKDAVSNLVRHFQDDQIGGVVGESTYIDEATSSQAQEGLYWRYETWIKEHESGKGSVVGGDGAIYAIRKSLFAPMAASDLSDFVNPLHVVRQGYRCIYDRQARSYESAATTFQKEFRRKVRIVNRAWRALWNNSDLLNPFKYRGFALKLISHKLLRWIAPLAFITLFFSNCWLVLQGRYPELLLLQVAFYAVAAFGMWVRDVEQIPSLLKVPYYFCLMNIAAFKGVLEVYIGKTYTTWTTARQ